MRARPAALLATFALIGTMTACTFGDDDGGDRAAPGGPPAGNVPPAVPQVARPWQEGMPQLGVNLLWEDSKEDGEDVTRAKARRILDHLVALNVNSVAVNFLFVMDGPRASAVGPDPRHTPSPARLAIFLEEARASRMRVAVRPILDEQSLLPSWRGKIKPASRDRWFADYAKFLASYGAVAQQHEVAELVVGVELNSLQRDRRWAGLIATVRKSFTGELAYSANFDEFQKGSRAPAVDTVGVDAYFKVDEPDDAPVSALTSAWVRWLDRYAGRRATKLVLHEVGIAAQDGAYHHPAQWGSTEVPLNLDVQKRWYQAVCAAAQRKKLAGVYFWNIRMHTDPPNANPKSSDRLTFVNRPAETVIRDCYAEWGGEQP